MEFKSIGQIIAKARQTKNLTQSELAEKLNVSDKTIGNWENNRNLPKLSILKPLCNILNIKITDLIDI